MARTTVPELDAEQRLSRMIGQYVDAGRPGIRFFVRRPRRLVRFVRDLGRLPTLQAGPGSSADGLAVRRAIDRPTYAVRTRWQRLASVLAVPEDPERYPLGRSRHPLRRHVRIGDRAGFRWREVGSRADRLALLAVADDLEAAQAGRTGGAFVSGNADTLDYRLWLVAEDAAGAPLQLAVAAVDGRWAALRFYRALTEGPERSIARYWLMPHVVSALAALGVRHLVDTVSPAALPNGLREYQRDVGFLLVDVRLTRGDAVPRPSGGRPAVRRSS